MEGIWLQTTQTPNSLGLIYLQLQGASVFSVGTAEVMKDHNACCVGLRGVSHDGNRGKKMLHPYQLSSRFLQEDILREACVRSLCGTLK